MTPPRQTRASGRKNNPVCDPEQLVKNLASMRKTVASLEPHVRVLSNWKNVSRDDVTASSQLVDARVAVAKAYQTLDRDHATILFQGILQQFEMEPRLRTRIEAGSRFYARRRYPRAGRAKQMLTLAHQYKKFLTAAELAMSTGKPHASCSVSSAR